MPQRPLKPCRQVGCAELVQSGYCYNHKKQRDTANKRGYDRQWRDAREIYLQQHPFCTECQKEGKLVRATVVDHIIAHKGNRELFWDVSNWQPLCSSCHSKKTVNEDGGFGR